MNKNFILDLKHIRKQARINLKQGAVTENYKLDLNTMYVMLNAALATEKNRINPV